MKTEKNNLQMDKSKMQKMMQIIITNSLTLKWLFKL